jgi:PAS domain S-box-containing protein
MPQSKHLKPLGAPARRLWLYGLTLIAIPLLFEIVLIAVLHWQVAAVETQLEQLKEARLTSNSASAIEKLILDLYMLLIIAGSTQSEFAMDQLDSTVKKIDQELDTIKSTRGAGALDSIRKLESRLEPVLKKINELKTSIDSETEISNQLPQLYADLILLHDLTKSGLESFQKSQFALQSQLEMARLDRTRALQATLIIGLFASLGVSLAVALMVANLFNRRLQVVVDNTGRMSRGESLLPPLSGEDEISHLDSAFRDMADALAIVEKHERDLIDNSTELICSIDEGGSIIEISSSAIDFLGVAPESLRGLRFMSIISQEQRAEIHGLFEKHKEADKPFVFETRLARNTRSACEISWSARWNKEKQTFFMVGHDVTERNQAERLKQELIAMITHDIRTPLQTVDMNLDILANPLMHPQWEGSILRARRAADQVLRLAQDFLELDKIDSGMTTLFIEKVDLQILLSESIDLVSGATKEKGLIYTIKGSAGKCSCDQRRIVQVLSNLLSNASKFSPAGGEIAVSVSTESNRFIFSVQDSGPGIPRELLPYVFERYRQTHKEKASRLGGTGLGLAICQSLVHLHNGEIWVESKEGEGTRFCFSIPA